MRTILVLLYVLMAFSCRSPWITTAWKADHGVPVKFGKIIVVGIVKSSDDSLRMQVERDFVLGLNNLGYTAISAVAEFGRKGLSNLGEVEVYKKLCNDGIDAVMTITLIDCNKEPRQTYRKMYGYPSNYYYNRIWNYKNIQADLEGNNNNTNGRYFWESILFNLNMLEAECTIQTRPFRDFKLVKMTHEFEAQVIRKMIKEKILARQQLKPF